LNLNNLSLFLLKLTSFVLNDLTMEFQQE